MTVVWILGGCAGLVLAVLAGLVITAPRFGFSRKEAALMAAPCFVAGFVPAVVLPVLLGHLP